MAFGGNYMVKPEKIIRFLMEKIFTHTRIQIINLELGYKGVIGLLQHDPQEYPDLALNEEREILASFCSGMEARRKTCKWFD